jgi:hypothetical protein
MAETDDLPDAPWVTGGEDIPETARPTAGTSEPDLPDAPWASSSATDALPDAPWATSSQPEPFDEDEFLRKHNAPESSAGGAFVRGALRSVVPTATSLPLMGAGMRAGARAGAGAGPWGAAGGAVAGALVGGAAGGYLGETAQNYLLEKTGLRDKEQEQADLEQHPYASMAGGFLPSTVAFSPGDGATTLATRAAGAMLQGGMEAGSELANEGTVDPYKVAMQTTFGAVFAKPTKLGARAMGEGAPPTPPGHTNPPGRPDLNPTEPLAGTAKDDVASNVPPLQTRGVSPTPPPPVEGQPTVGNPQSAPGRSSRVYPKDNAEPKGEVAYADVPDDVKAALLASVDTHGYKPPAVEGPRSADEPPIETGLTAAVTPPAPAARPRPPTLKPQPLDLSNLPPPARAPEPAPAPRQMSDEEVLAAARASRQAEEAVHQRIQAGQTNEDVVLTPEQEARVNRPAAPQTREEPPPVDTGIAEAAAKTNVNPTEAQKESGRYTKGKATIFGQKVAIENPRGSTRSGTDAEGKPWSVKMQAHYGEIEGTRGADGDKVDAYIGRNPKSKTAFVVDQHDPSTGKFDEHKVMFGYPDEASAVKAYKAHFNDGKADQRMGAVHAMDEKQFGEWVKDRKATKAPVAEHAIDAEAMSVEPPKPGRRQKAMLNLGEPVERAPQGVTEGSRPKVVDTAIEAARAAGHDKVVAALEKADAKRGPQLARRYLEGTTNKSGAIQEKDYASARVPSKPAQVEGMEGVTARSKADAERKSKAIGAIRSAFEKYPPTSDVLPVGKEAVAALKRRLQDALIHAEKQNGGDPLAYKPRVKPGEWLWLREARKLVTGRMTQKQVNDFIATEKQLRSGKTEDVENVRQGNRVEADIAMARRPDAEAAHVEQAAKEFPGEVPHEDAEADTIPRDVTAADLQPSKKVKELDISKLDPKEHDQLVADQEKITQSLIEAFDKRNAERTGGKRVLESLVEPDWKVAEAARAEKTAARAAELKALREKHRPEEPKASEVRKVDVTEEAVKAAEESLKKAMARGESRAKPTPKEDPAVMPKGVDLGEFWNNESGALNIKAIDARMRATVGAVRQWLSKTFGQPLSDIAYKADALMAQMASTKQQLNNAHMRLLDADWHRFTKLKNKNDSFDFLHVLETTPAAHNATFDANLQTRGVAPADAGWMSQRAPVYRDMLDRAYNLERQFGSQAEYIDNYVPHVFVDAKQAKSFIHRQIQTLGPTWFQKQRSFDLIQQAVAAGFKLKFDNPVDLIGHRLAASEDMMLKVGLLNKMQDIGAAYPSQSLPPRARLWTKVNAPDHQQWSIAPEVEHLWQNAIEARGLWDADGALGTGFRAWMKAKNVWVPIKLAVSAFHLLHVVGNVNIAENIARGLHETGFQDKLKRIGEGLKLSVTDPLLALPLEHLPLVGQHMPSAVTNYPGKQLRRAWGLPESQMTPDQRLAVKLYEEAGVSPQLSEQLRVAASRDMTKAIADFQRSPGVGPGMRIVGNAFRRTVEKAQGWMFEELIPNLKAAQMMRATEQLLRNDPSLVQNSIGRRLALRAIGKSIDDRFGEMFYGSLFWDRTVKDVSIGSMLSLGWNLGQFRQAGGALSNLATKTGGRGSHAQQEIYNATNKGAYVTSYMALSMMTAGIMSYALSGVFPTGMDYFFPRAGGTNPEGKPRRLSTMFNTRELPMVHSHIQEQNSVVGGLMTLLYNKMVISPLVDLWHNRDFFGNQLYDPDAPGYKKIAQMVDSTLGNTFNPITLSGAKRAKEQGGTTRDTVLSYAGFGPAPAYISRSAIQNRISHQYNEHVAPTSRPYEDSGSGLVQGIYRAVTDNPTQSEARRTARGELNRAMQEGDTEAAGVARRKLIATGMSPTTIGKLRPGESDVYMFSRLPLTIQRNLVGDMSQDEWVRYVQHNKALVGKARVELIKARPVK